MPVTIKRTVIVGLGGTGTRVLQYIKGEFHKHFSKGVPPAVKLLAIDTAPQRAAQAGAVGSIAALQDGKEFFHITSTSIRRLLLTDEMQAWAPPLDKWNLSDIRDGAGQMRISGRLALFGNATTIYNALATAIKQAKDQSLPGMMEDWPDFSLTEKSQTTDVEVYVVGSLAGGTGSGMFLDIGYMIRKILEEEKGSDRILGVFLLPGIFMKNLAAVDFVAGNGYAALKELDHWLGELEEQEVRYPGGVKVKWGGLDREPYKFIYLLDDVNESGAVVNHLETMLDFVARGLFLHMTIQSNELAEFWINLASSLQRAGTWPKDHPDGKIPRYMSFGLSSIQVPLERQLEQNILEILIGHLGTLRSPEFTTTPEKLDQAVKDFISTNRLDAEALVERLRPQDFRWDVPQPPDRPWTRTGDILPWKEQAVVAFEEQLRRGVGEHTQTFAELQQEAIRTLLDHIYRIVLKEVGHIRHAQLLVERLAQYLKEIQTNLKTNEDRLEQQIAAVEFAPWESALGGLFPKRKIEKLVNDYRQALGNLARLKLQCELHRLAGVLAGSLIIKATKLKDELEQFDLHLGRTLSMLRADLSNLERRRSAVMDVFATVLREEEVESAFLEKHPNIGLDTLERAWHDFPASYAHERGTESLFNPRTLLGWRHRSPEEIADWLKREVYKAYTDLMAQSLDSIIDRLWKESEKAGTDVSQKLRQRLQAFLDLARPFWRVQVEPGQDIEYLLLIGIHERPDVQVPFVRDKIEKGEIVVGGAAHRSRHYASTWEQFTIRALRIGVPAPAYALNKMRIYKQKYLDREASPRSRVTHHIHREWMGPNGLPDLFPEGLE